jgi:hypothetical protein
MLHVTRDDNWNQLHVTLGWRDRAHTWSVPMRWFPWWRSRPSQADVILAARERAAKQVEDDRVSGDT